MVMLTSLELGPISSYYFQDVSDMAPLLLLVFVGILSVSLLVGKALFIRSVS